AATLTSITLSWTTGGASNWQIEYGAVGSVPGGGTIVNATSNPFTITGLSPGTTYAMVVRDSCGLGSTSAWSAIITGSTLCGTVLAPLTQNFDVGFNEGAMGPNFWNAGSTIDPCWSRNPNSAGTSAVYHWGGGSGNTPTANTGPTSDHTSGSGNYVYTESSYGSASETALLETPLIDLSALTAPELKFWFHMRGSSIQSLRIDIYSATSGSYTPIDSIVGDQGNAWFERVINLSTYVNQTIKVRFRAAKNSTTASQRADIAIDDFSISNAPNCPAPTNLAVTPLTSTTASVSWLSGGSGTAVLEYGPTGFTVGTGTLVTTTSNPYILTGLTAGVLYDLYVVDSCGASSYSTLTGPVSMQTFNCSNGCVYTLDLSDTFGDGWDANWQGSVQHKITLTTGGITTDYSMANGSAASFSINVCDGDTLRLRFVNGGQWSNECGWVLKDANGVTINSQTAGANITTGFKYNGSSSCSNPCPTPIASFTSSSNGLTITYDASASTGTALTYFWDYGDGNNGTVNPAVNPYSSAGNYQVTLIVTDQCGQTDTLIQNIEVCDTVLQPFTYTTQIFQIGFTGPLNPADYSYIAWNFGDGTSTTGADPSHTYSTGGQYTVVLTVVNLCGDTLTDTQVLDICSKPVAAFTWFIVSSSGSGMLVQFDATSTVGANSYLWSWGDGTSSTGTNYTQHNYSVPSLLYNVTLIVNSACGLSDTTTHRLDELGLDEPGALGAVNAYPNPLTGAQTLTIAHWLPQSRSLVTVSDGMGRVVLQRVLDFDTKGEALLGMQSLAAGVYHIELLADDRRAFLRIVTQK
ncbi:MAG: PKD domain-containing protein, partial [Schleiferiaceae bacterium]|nr:PKD domain-containing protein [Schleiferiaceae bacterium]